MRSPTAVLAALFALPAAVFAADEPAWFDLHGEYSFDLVSAYMSRAKIYEDRPIQMNELTADMGLGPLGRIGLWYWNYSSLSDCRQDVQRRFVPEQNEAVTYDYDWKFAEGWSLDTEVMAEWQTFHGIKDGHEHSSFEWRIKQQLKNPYVTPYYKGRFTLRPIAYDYWQVGLKKSFKPAPWVKLTPHVAVDMADERGVRKRFGLKRDDVHAGALSVIAELTAEFPITEWFSVHATVGQFDKINGKGRDSSNGVNRRDLTYGQIGFTCSF